MAILGNLIKKGITIRESLEQQYTSPYELQKNELRKLLITARETAFGKEYDFKSILNSFKNNDHQKFYIDFSKNVPTHTYDEMYNRWWHNSKSGQKNICWPGKVNFFALSSGTSGASSKYIPITKDQLKAIQKTSIRQILSLSRFNIPNELFTSDILMLGGSTHLKHNGTFLEGDLSGITAKNLPFWFQPYYKPGQKIAKHSDWEEKLEEITRKAKNWNIGFVAGVPAWIQILFEKIIAFYGVNNIHEIWPNFKIFVHGGVALEPYLPTFHKLLGKEISFIETYLASEGFIAFQNRPNAEGMRIVLNNGIFYEFIPYDDANFNSEGELLDNPQSYMFHEIEENRDYAIVISTCGGAWRYLIGDTIRLVNKEYSEIKITGRTKHFLSLCGEHTSVDNMNQAISLLEKKFNLGIKEYTVAGEPYKKLFAHHWYIGTENKKPVKMIKEELDKFLRVINDDYNTERNHALSEIFVDLIPNSKFYEFMKMNGKDGGQNKFPRVLKGDKLENWKSFLNA